MKAKEGRKDGKKGVMMLGGKECNDDGRLGGKECNDGHGWEGVLWCWAGKSAMMNKHFM